LAKLTSFIRAAAVGGMILTAGLTNSTPLGGTAPVLWTKPLLQIQRTRVTREATYGTLSIAGHEICDTMERNSRIIPAGTYSVILTYSPHFRRILPLILVKGRSGIRIHPASSPNQLEGCIGVDDDALEVILQQIQGVHGVQLEVSSLPA
jgi:Family of unknown function (DUF5675)